MHCESSCHNPTEERGLESGIAFAEYDELVDRCVEHLGPLIVDARR